MVSNSIASALSLSLTHTHSLLHTLTLADTHSLLLTRTHTHFDGEWNASPFYSLHLSIYYFLLEQILSFNDKTKRTNVSLSILYHTLSFSLTHKHTYTHTHTRTHNSLSHAFLQSHVQSFSPWCWYKRSRLLFVWEIERIKWEKNWLLNGNFFWHSLAFVDLSTFPGIGMTFLKAMAI